MSGAKDYDFKFDRFESSYGILGIRVSVKFLAGATWCPFEAHMHVNPLHLDPEGGEWAIAKPDSLALAYKRYDAKRGKITIRADVRPGARSAGPVTGDFYELFDISLRVTEPATWDHTGYRNSTIIDVDIFPGQFYGERMHSDYMQGCQYLAGYKRYLCAELWYNDPGGTDEPLFVLRNAEYIHYMEYRPTLGLRSRLFVKDLLSHIWNQEVSAYGPTCIFPAESDIHITDPVENKTRIYLLMMPQCDLSARWAFVHDVIEEYTSVKCGPGTVQEGNRCVLPSPAPDPPPLDPPPLDPPPLDPPPLDPPPLDPPPTESPPPADQRPPTDGSRNQGEKKTTPEKSGNTVKEMYDCGSLHVAMAVLYPVGIVGCIGVGWHLRKKGWLSWLP